MTQYAETWLDVGRLPLRRRDVNAMRLALDVLRTHGGPDAWAVREATKPLGWVHWLYDHVDAAQEHGVPARLLRARLALLLRVLLRVDAEREAYGPRAVGCWWADCRRCEGTGAHSAQWLGIDCPACEGEAVELAPLVIRPLWEIRR